MLTDQSNAQNFVDSHVGLVQDGNHAYNVDGILAMVAWEPAQVCLVSWVFNDHYKDVGLMTNEGRISG